MEAAASDGPMEGLPLRLEKCRATFPQPSHRILEIAPATSRLHDSHSRLENADSLPRTLGVVRTSLVTSSIAPTRPSAFPTAPTGPTPTMALRKDTQKEDPPPPGSVTYAPGPKCYPSPRSYIHHPPHPDPHPPQSGGSGDQKLPASAQGTTSPSSFKPAAGAGRCRRPAARRPCRRRWPSTGWRSRRWRGRRPGA